MRNSTKKVQLLSDITQGRQYKGNFLTTFHEKTLR